MGTVILSRRLANNMFILALARMWRLGSGFILAPYVLAHLGPEQYGLFAVLGTVTLYIGLLDFGLGSAFIKHLAEYVAKGQHKYVQQVLTFGLLFYLLLGLILAPIAFVAFPFVINLLILSPELKGTGVDLLKWLFAYFFLAQAISVFSQLQNSMQRMRVTAIISSVAQLIYCVAVVLLLQAGLGLNGLLAASFVSLLFGAVAGYVAAIYTIGPVFLNPLHIEASVVRSLLKFGGWMQAISLSILVNAETDRFLIGSFVSVASVTPYELANKLAFLTKAFPGFGFEALLPAVASVAAQGDPVKLERACLHASRAIACLTLAIGGFTIAAASPLLYVWVGQAYPEAPVIMVMLVVAYMVHNLTGVGSTVLRATGMPRYEAYYCVLGVVLNVAATLALAPKFGLFGIIIGTVIGTVIGSTYFIWLFYRIRRTSLWLGLGQWLWRLAAAAGAATGSLAWIVGLLPTAVFANRILGLVVLGLLGVAYLAWFIVLLRLTGFFQPSDFVHVRNILPPWCVRLFAWRVLQRAVGWILL